MVLASNEFARRADGAVEIDPQPLRLSWPLMGLISADAHTLAGRLTVSARLADDPTDRKMFAEVMLAGKMSLTVGDVAEHFAVAIRNAAGSIASKHSAEQWLSGERRQEMIDAMAKAAQGVAFACGMEILPPYELEITSPSLNEKRLAEFARARSEERAQGQMAHLKLAGEVLAKFKEMRESAPDVPAGVLLERLSPADRGSVLQTLLAGSAEKCEQQTLWAVAGPNLLRIDARANPAKVETIALPATLGPLRSVQAGEIRGQRNLLVGARDGVIVVSLNQLDQTALYRDSSIRSELGFNRVISCGGRIWGCHGEAGLIAWGIDRPDEPEVRIPIPVDAPMVGSSGMNTGGKARRASPRNLQTIDEQYAIYSLGGVVKLLYGTIPVDLPTTNSSEVIAIVPETTRLLIVRRDGCMDVMDRATRRIAASIRGAGKTNAAAALPWLGSVRLVLASDDGPIDCVGLDDSHVTRFTSHHSDLRAISACADQVAAVSSDRQRLIVWRSWESTPAAEIHIAAMVRHRVADIEYV
ncbi:MAG TPA: hypothetical protein VHS31_06295 [Tepidisphaeraceae bacterium]|nr:hypothetical protein [Tepidisphaeraceae bacterium]